MTDPHIYDLLAQQRAEIDKLRTVLKTSIVSTTEGLEAMQEQIDVIRGVIDKVLLREAP